MTYDRPHFYLTFGGTLYPLAGQKEQWQTGLHFAGSSDHTEGDYLAALGSIEVADILADVTKLIQGGYGFNMHWSNVVSVDWAKLAVKKTNGEYAGNAKVAEQPGKLGDAGSFSFAPQLAVVVSFWSGSNFGQANRGRMYLPPPNPLLQSLTPSDPRATKATADDLRTAMIAFLHDVSGEVSTVGLGTQPVIMSKLASGTTKSIQAVAVGRVVDTMRSRRTSLDEELSFVAYP